MNITLQPSVGVPAHPTGGHSGLPADILIGADGTVLDANYGRHAADQ